MNRKKEQLSSYHVYCIFLYHISHITYQNIWDHVSHVSISPHIQPKHWDITHLHCELWWFRWRWRPQFHDPDGTDGPRGVGVPLCPGLLTSSWAATIHQDRASRTRAATGVRLGYLNWYNAAVDDVRCTCTNGFTVLPIFVISSNSLVKQLRVSKVWIFRARNKKAIWSQLLCLLFCTLQSSQLSKPSHA